MGYYLFRVALAALAGVLAWMLVVAAGLAFFLHAAEHLPWAQHEWLWVTPGCLIMLWWIYKTIWHTRAEQRLSRIGRLRLRSH